jgi:hypothetical protein
MEVQDRPIGLTLLGTQAVIYQRHPYKSTPNPAGVLQSMLRADMIEGTMRRQEKV